MSVLLGRVRQELSTLLGVEGYFRPFQVDSGWRWETRTVSEGKQDSSHNALHEAERMEAGGFYLGRKLVLFARIERAISASSDNPRSFSK